MSFDSLFKISPVHNEHMLCSLSFDAQTERWDRGSSCIASGHCRSVKYLQNLKKQGTNGYKWAFDLAKLGFRSGQVTRRREQSHHH